MILEFLGFVYKMLFYNVTRQKEDELVNYMFESKETVLLSTTHENGCSDLQFTQRYRQKSITFLQFYSM